MGYLANIARRAYESVTARVSSRRASGILVIPFLGGLAACVSTATHDALKTRHGQTVADLTSAIATLSSAVKTIGRLESEMGTLRRRQAEQDQRSGAFAYGLTLLEDQHNRDLADVYGHVTREDAGLAGETAAAEGRATARAEQAERDARAYADRLDVAGRAYTNGTVAGLDSESIARVGSVTAVRDAAATALDAYKREEAAREAEQNRRLGAAEAGIRAVGRPEPERAPPPDPNDALNRFVRERSGQK